VPEQVIEKLTTSGDGEAAGSVAAGSVAAQIADHFSLGQVRTVDPTPQGANANNVFLDTSDGRWVVRVDLAGSGGGQLLRERFFARLIDEATELRAPWPYRVDLTCNILPIPYAVMPRLPGANLSWFEPHDWGAVGEALAIGARKLHASVWPEAAEWDAATGEIRPSSIQETDRVAGRAAKSCAKLDDGDNSLDGTSAQWLADALAELDSGPAPTSTTLVHGDLVIENMTFSERDGAYDVIGVLDLEDARLGDPDQDIVRHIWWSCFAGQPAAAETFVATYVSSCQVSARTRPYAVVDLLDVWEFGRSHGADWFGGAQYFCDWARPLFADVDRILSHHGV